MKTHIIRRSLLALATMLVIAAGPAFAAATITIVNTNGPGVGFNDPTPVAPVGGNPGTTLGQQRLNAFQFAANIWGATLDSNVEIFIQASFVPLSCTATSATLGSAGTIQIFANFPSNPPFPGPEFPNTWYHVALANKRAGFDLAPGPPGTSADDIRARFNSNIGSAGCLTGTFWYLGFDGNHGANIDLVTVLLHEFAHGLGFSQFANVSNGSQILGLTDVYGRDILDTTTGETWDQMTDAERTASAINPRRVVWIGSDVTSAVPAVLSPGTPLLKVNSPPPIAGVYAVGTAAFGGALSSPGVTGDIVYANPADGCSAPVNSVAGKIALVDRGTCTFVVKAQIAQAASAIALVVANNAPGFPPPGLGGSDPTITIPVVSITQADGSTIKAALPGVNATLGVDLSVFAGADPLGRALLYTPNPVQPGSTISHWDTIAFPNQLMEPNINSDLTHSVKPPEDLTLPLMRDVGWFPDADLDGVPDTQDQCLGSDLSPTVVIDGCNSGVPNTLFTDGCTISDLVKNCALGATNHGAFVSCVAHLTNGLKQDGLISGGQKGAIQSCAAHASIP